MITAEEMAIRRPAASRQPSSGVAAMPAPPSYAPPVDQQPITAVASFRERLLLITIYVTVLTSSIAFVQPSPHDALMVVLAGVCVVAEVSFPRKIVLLFLLLLIWNVSGFFSLLNVPDQGKTILYSSTSVYLSLAAVMWSCIFAQNTMARLSVMRSAYILTAFLVAIAGICGYLSAFPGAHALFAHNDRASGAFKDPNVFGPFLIWPALFVLHRMLVNRVKLTDIVVVATLAVALLLAFSRGAWFHFGLSCLVMLVLAFLTAQSVKTRLRIVVLTGLAVAILAVFIVFLLSIPVVHKMFEIRAHLLQSYDVGQGGRFRLQELAVAEVLSHFNGMGPFGFASTHANQQHEVYLQAFLVYGWFGGVAFILLVLSTLFVAFRAVFVATPWQPYLVTALAAFVGEVAEGFIIDSDHWRHFFLLMGMIWGMWVATLKYLRARHNRAPRPLPPTHAYPVPPPVHASKPGSPRPVAVG